MNTLTKEWLLKTIAELEEERDAVPGVVNEDAAMALAAMKLALASLEAEPVYQVFSFKRWRDVSEEVFGEEKKDGCQVRVLYTAPPAPVAVLDDNAITQHFDTIALETAREIMCDVNRRHEFLGGEVQLLSRIQCRIDDACRTAMLQGAELQNRQQNIPENIPATQFKPVADLYGLTSPTGGETSFTFDAVEARDFIDGGWSCQEYVELGRFQEAMLQNGNSPAQSDCCPEQNYIAPAQDGDSPVIPDGWVLVPEEPTHEMLEAGDEQFGTYDMYRRMIAASPQQK